jgi:hypothetical protein
LPVIATAGPKGGAHRCVVIFASLPELLTASVEKAEAINTIRFVHSAAPTLRTDSAKSGRSRRR